MPRLDSQRPVVEALAAGRPAHQAWPVGPVAGNGASWQLRAPAHVSIQPPDRQPGARRRDSGHPPLSPAPPRPAPAGRPGRRRRLATGSNLTTGTNKVPYL